MSSCRLPRPGEQESRFFAGRQTLTQDASFLFRLGRELVSGLRALAAAGPCLLVTGRAPEGWSWIEALAVCRATGVWCAAQGFGVLTMDEAGLAEALASSCERAGGRAVRCGLAHSTSAHRLPALATAPGSRLDFTLELARRIACAKFARATLALSPNGESAGTLNFLHALARFERLTEHPVLLLGAGQWDFSSQEVLFPLATRLIEDVGELASALNFR